MSMLARWQPMSSKLECSRRFFSELLLLLGTKSPTETLVPSQYRATSKAIFSRLRTMAGVPSAVVNFRLQIFRVNLTLTCSKCNPLKGLRLNPRALRSLFESPHFPYRHSLQDGTHA